MEALRSVKRVKPNGIGSFRSIKSVKPNCKGVLKGFSCWFKMWKVLGN